MTGYTEKELNRLVDSILQLPRHEMFHERDCFGCDLAMDIAASIWGHWDHDETWNEIPADDGLPGDTMYQQLLRTIAYTLHRRLPDHQPCPTYPDGPPRKDQT